MTDYYYDYDEIMTIMHVGRFRTLKHDHRNLKFVGKADPRNPQTLILPQSLMNSQYLSFLKNNWGLHFEFTFYL